MECLDGLGLVILNLGLLGTTSVGESSNPVATVASGEHVSLNGVAAGT